MKLARNLLCASLLGALCLATSAEAENTAFAENLVAACERDIVDCLDRYYKYTATLSEAGVDDATIMEALKNFAGAHAIDGLEAVINDAAEEFADPFPEEPPHPITHEADSPAYPVSTPAPAEQQFVSSQSGGGLGPVTSPSPRPSEISSVPPAAEAPSVSPAPAQTGMDPDWYDDTTVATLYPLAVATETGWWDDR